VKEEEKKLYANELFPDWLFEDPRLPLVFSRCISRLSPALTKRLFDGIVISLKPNETIIERPIDPRLRLSDDEFRSCLLKLQELNMISLTDHEKYYLVRCITVPVPIINDVVNCGQIPGDSLTQISFKVFSERYLEHVKDNLAPKTLENARRVMSHANKRFGNQLLSKLSPQNLEEYKSSRRDEDKANPTTINMDVRTLKSALQMAIAWGYLKENPFRHIKAIRQQRQIPLSMSKEDFSLLISFTENDRLKALFRFAFLTGMRRGEILNLEWKDIDYENKLISIQSSPDYRVKHGKARIIPMNKEVETILKGLEPCDPYIFMNEKMERFAEDFVTKSFKKAVRAAALDDRLHFHNLRHTCASWLAQAGVPMTHIKDLLGHAYIKTTESYTRIPARELRGAVELLTLPPATNSSTNPPDGSNV